MLIRFHGNLATKISEFWTYWNPCVKDFRILDLLEPLRQRFPDFQITPEILSIYGIMSSEPRHWMVFGQLEMAGWCCDEAWRRRWRCLSTALPRAHPRPKPGPTQARFEISGTLEIQKFGIPWNPCDKDFRFLDLLETLRQRFHNFGPTGTLASKISRFPDAAGGGAAERILRSQPDPSPNAPRDQIRRKGPCCDQSQTSILQLL